MVVICFGVTLSFCKLRSLSDVIDFWVDTILKIDQWHLLSIFNVYKEDFIAAPISGYDEREDLFIIAVG